MNFDDLKRYWNAARQGASAWDKTVSGDMDQLSQNIGANQRENMIRDIAKALEDRNAGVIDNVSQVLSDVRDDGVLPKFYVDKFKSGLNYDDTPMGVDQLKEYAATYVDQQDKLGTPRPINSPHTHGAGLARAIRDNPATARIVGTTAAGAGSIAGMTAAGQGIHALTKLMQDGLKNKAERENVLTS
jgi:cystathionine beta-lyase family protein involved in aluminum resistance